MATETMVLFSSEEAATIKTVTGWVSRDGFFWGQDERMARYSGCTHQPCDECGMIRARNSYCEPCRSKKVEEAYLKMPRKEWDGSEPIVILDSDTYFFDESELENYCEEHDVKAEDLKLVFCEPIYPQKFDAEDYFCDQMPSDGGELSAAILEAAELLSKAIEESPALSWIQGNVAVQI